MKKELKIIPPEGYEIDKENSTFECIKFKKIEKSLPKTWEEFCELKPHVDGEYNPICSVWRRRCCDLLCERKRNSAKQRDSRSRISTLSTDSVERLL